MKKLFSLILAMLMLAMPVFSGAEDATSIANTAFDALTEKDFTTKYVLQGQEVTAEVSIETTDLAYATLGLPEETASSFKDFVNSIGFRSTFQTIDKQVQSGFALLLDGETALDTIVAFGNKSIYATSNLLGDKILQMTSAQIKERMNQTIDQMVAEGQISQELVDSAKNFYREFRQDPFAAMKKLIGEPDFQPVLSALQSLLMNIQMEEVTEAPEAFPTAMAVIIIPITKEGLTSVTTELAKLIWNVPAIQKLASMAKEAPTEEKVVAAFNKLADALAEDTEVRVYMDETGRNYYITGSAKVTKGETTKTISYDQLIQIQENNTAHMEMQVAVDSGEKVSGVMDMIMIENGANVNYNITVDDLYNGVPYQAVEEIISMNIVMGETSQDVTMDITARVKESPDSEQVGLVMKTIANETDMGDHAEGHGTFTMAKEGLGDLMTITITEKTDLAEAYIITPDALQPATMDGEELGALLQEGLTNAGAVLMSILPKLPQELQQIVITMLMGGGN